MFIHFVFVFVLFQRFTCAHLYSCMTVTCFELHLNCCSMGKRKGRTHRNRKTIHHETKFNHGNNDYNVVAEMMSWMKSNGFQKSVKLSPYYFVDKSGRGLMCKKNIIHSGQKLIEIPWNLLITRQTVIASDLPIDYQDHQTLNCIELLTLFLSWEKLKGKSSFWFYYIESLPVHFDGLPHFKIPKQDINKVKPESLSRLIMKEFDKFENSRENILKIVEKSSHEMMKKMIFLIENNKNKNDFCDLLTWSWCAVNTRCISLSLSSSSDQDTKECALAPFLDLLNHSCHVRTKAGFNLQTNCFDIITLTEYHKKDQIFINYGPHSNRHLLLYYGFILDDNPNNFITVTYHILLLLIPSKHYHIKQRLNTLKRIDFINENSVLKIYKDSFDWKLDVILRLFSLNSWYDDATIKSMIYNQFKLNDGELVNYKSIKKTLLTQLLNQYSNIDYFGNEMLKLLLEQEIDLISTFLKSS